MFDKSADFLLRHIRLEEWTNSLQDWAIKAPGDTTNSICQFCDLHRMQNHGGQ